MLPPVTNSNHGETTMKMIAAAILAILAMTTTADADVRYYIDHDVLRANHSTSLLTRAMRDVGKNPTGWSHRWCGKQMALWAGGGSNLARDWARWGRATHARPGAVGVMNGHVGVVKEVKGNRVVLVSGNHSGKSGRRTVGVGSYPMSRFIAFREPA